MSDNENLLHNIITNYSSVLFFTDSSQNEALCAALAIARLLTRNGKRSAIYLPRAFPAKLSFLNIAPHVITNLKYNEESTIVLNHPQLGADDLRLEKQPGRLHIILRKTIPREAVHIEMSGASWQAVVGVGVPEEELLKRAGALRQKELPDLFLLGEAAQNIPAIFEKNIKSYCELITKRLKECAAEHITPEVATPLLAGIILRTQNFQSSSLNPQTLFTAAYLISKGAKQQIIIRNLYKTKSLELVRLWGKALVNFRYEDDARLATSHINLRDIGESGASFNHIGQLMNELKNNFLQAEIFILGVEKKPSEHIALIHARNKNAAQSFMQLTGIKYEGRTTALRLMGVLPLDKKILKLSSDLRKFLLPQKTNDDF